MTPTPAETQHEIRHGDHRAAVTTVGATLRELHLDGKQVIDGFGPEETSSAGRGQVLAPWPNRLQDGTYAFEGREAQAAIDEPERGNAIHGLVRWIPWQVDLMTADAIVLRCVVERQPAYPWEVELQISYVLSRPGLRVTTTARNRSEEPAPFGIGFHPYLTVGTGTVDDAVLAVPAEQRLLTDDRALPTGRAEVAGTELDFTGPRPIGPTQMDTAFTELERDARGRTSIRLERPDGDRAVRLWMEEDFRYVMVYTGDTLEPVSRRRQGVAIEPMTCPPNALRTGTDLIRLAPGGSWTADWGIST